MGSGSDRSKKNLGHQGHERDASSRLVYGGYEYDPRTKLWLGSAEEPTDVEEILIQTLNPDQLALEGLKKESNGR